MKKIFIYLILLLFCFSLITKSEEPNKKTSEYQKIHEYIYTETMLENFETETYSNDNLKFMKGGERDGMLTISDNYPAPVNNSKKYLAVRVYAKRGDLFKIVPAKPIEIMKYCKTISIWVYGEKIAGEISILLQDSSGINHTLHFGSAASHGWKKLSKTLDTKIKQHDDYVGNKNSTKILYIQYRAAGNAIYPEWQFFYIDDITASVRDKYMDRDDW